jgi:hypothetical protein
MDFTYGDCKKEMDMVNKAFIEIMIEGDANGRGFQYPIPTYSITKDFDWSDTENNRLLFEMTAKYGTPYFSNYINSDMEPSDVRSMCCRLRLDLRELRKKSGGFFGSGESTGSVGVVTINMPRIAYQAADKADFYRRLDHMMDIARKSLKVKRTVITKLLNEGLYPYTKRYLGTFDNHFSTIGLVGMNEAGLNAKWVRADMTHPECQKFTKEVLNHMRSACPTIRSSTATSTIWRPPRPNPPPTVWPSTTWSSSPTSSPRPRPAAPRITPTPAICPWAIPRTSSRRWTCRTSCRPVHLRHRVPRLPGREAARLEGRRQSGAQDRGKLQAAVLHAPHHLPHLFHLQEPRLPRRRAVHLPRVRRKDRGVQPHHRLLPPGAELERRQDTAPMAVSAKDSRAPPWTMPYKLVCLLGSMTMLRVA